MKTADGERIGHRGKALGPPAPCGHAGTGVQADKAVAVQRVVAQQSEGFGIVFAPERKIGRGGHRRRAQVDEQGQQALRLGQLRRPWKQRCIGLPCNHAIRLKPEYMVRAKLADYFRRLRPAPV